MINIQFMCVNLSFGVTLEVIVLAHSGREKMAGTLANDISKDIFLGEIVGTSSQIFLKFVSLEQLTIIQQFYSILHSK